MEEQEYQSALGKAMAMWSKGQHIPVDLFAELAAEGFDVPALEDKHFNYNT